MLILETYS